MNKIKKHINLLVNFSMKISLLYCVIFSFPSFAKDNLSAFMKTDKYINDRLLARTIIKSYTYLKFETQFDNFTNYRLPFEQLATIESAKQWNVWTKDFCDLVEKTKYKQLRANINTNIVAEGKQLIVFDNDFQYNLIKRNCSETRRFVKSIISNSGGGQFNDLVNKGLKYYREQVERAGKSNLFLGKVFADTNGSTFKTVRSVKRRLETMIKTHEILFANSDSSDWRMKFTKLNDQFSSMRNQSIGKVIKKFKKPRANKNPKKREDIIKRVEALLTDSKIENINHIMLADDDMRAFDKVYPTKKGSKMKAIAFYVLSNDNTLLTYAWYEIDNTSKKDATYIVYQEKFKQ